MKGEQREKVWEPLVGQLRAPRFKDEDELAPRAYEIEAYVSNTTKGYWDSRTLPMVGDILMLVTGRKEINKDIIIEFVVVSGGEPQFWGMDRVNFGNWTDEVDSSQQEVQSESEGAQGL